MSAEKGAAAVVTARKGARKAESREFQTHTLSGSESFRGNPGLFYTGGNRPEVTARPKEKGVGGGDRVGGESGMTHHAL